MLKRLLLHPLQMFLTKNAADLFLISCLLFSSLKLTNGIETIIDIILSDESYYLHNGVGLIHSGFPAAEWGPFYAIWYWFLSLFETNHNYVNLYYFNHKLLITLTTILLYISLRSLSCNRIIAATVSFIYLISGIPVIWPRPTHFALLLLLLFITLQKYLQPQLDFYLAFGMTTLFMSFVRPEYFLSFIVASILIAILVLRALILSTKSDKKSLFLRLFTYVVTALTLLKTLGIPTSSGNRSWWAFSQHFALRWTWTHSTDLDAWTDYEQIVQSAFGDANTIFEALKINPSAFFQHTLENIKGYFENSASILYGALKDFSPSLQDLSPTLNWWIRSIETALCLLVIVQILRKTHIVTEQVNTKTLTRLFVILTFIELSVLPASILIFPRYHYLITHVVVLCILLAYLASNTLQSKKWNIGFRRSLLMGCLILLLTPILSKGWCLTDEYCVFQRQQIPEKPNLETIRLIQSLQIEKPVNLLASDIEYPIYLGNNYRRVNPTGKNISFLEFLRKNQINMLVLSEELNRDVRFSSDPQWKDFLQNYQIFNYQRLSIPETKRSLLIRNTL